MIRRPSAAARAALALSVAALSAPAHAANQTPDASLSPVLLNSTFPFNVQIQTPASTGDVMPAIHSFSKAQINGQWLIVGGLTSGQHAMNMSGFLATAENTEAYVIDPATNQFWHRSFSTDPTSGLSAAQVDSLAVFNTEFGQQGNQLYIAGGYSQNAANSSYQTWTNLTAINIPGLVDWVKSGTGTAAGNIRQISDPIFQVTGGEMAMTSNGRTHLVFGQNFSSSYTNGANGIYTNQVRSFDIQDNGVSLAIANPTLGATNTDFRRRDLNVVPIIQNVGGQLVDKYRGIL